VAAQGRIKLHRGQELRRQGEDQPLGPQLPPGLGDPHTVLPPANGAQGVGQLEFEPGSTASPKAMAWVPPLRKV
jgi:hypothetical protein